MDDYHQKIGWLGLSLRHWRYALAAADHGGVTRAARALNVSQPAISAAIAALEDHYGTPLFTRAPRQGVALTSFGRSLFTEVRGLLKQAEAVAALRDTAGPPRGSLTFAIYDALAPYYLPAILTALGQALPQVKLRFVETRLDHVTQRLHDGSCDFAITYDVGLDADTEASPLYSLQPFVLCAAGHRFAARPSLRLADLASETLVVLDQETSAAYVLGLLHAHNVAPLGQLRAGSFELQRSLVANGLGVAISHTRPLVETSYDGKPLHHIALADPLAPQRVLLAASGRHRPQAAALAARVEIVRLFATLPPAIHSESDLNASKNVL